GPLNFIPDAIDVKKARDEHPLQARPDRVRRASRSTTRWDRGARAAPSVRLHQEGPELLAGNGGRRSPDRLRDAPIHGSRAHRSRGDPVTLYYQDDSI